MLDFTVTEPVLYQVKMTTPECPNELVFQSYSFDKAQAEIKRIDEQVFPRLIEASSYGKGSFHAYITYAMRDALIDADVDLKANETTIAYLKNKLYEYEHVLRSNNLLSE